MNVPEPFSKVTVHPTMGWWGRLIWCRTLVVVTNDQLSPVERPLRKVSVPMRRSSRLRFEVWPGDTLRFQLRVWFGTSAPDLGAQPFVIPEDFSGSDLFVRVHKPSAGFCPRRTTVEFSSKA